MGEKKPLAIEALARCGCPGHRAGNTDTLERRIAALEAAVATLQADPRDAGDRRLLEAIAGSVRGCVFSAGELLAHARVDDRLRAALGRLSTARRKTSPPVPFSSAKAIGLQLRRVAGRAIGGYVLRKVGRDASGCIWMVTLHETAGETVDDLA